MSIYPHLLLRQAGKRIWSLLVCAATMFDEAVMRPAINSSLFMVVGFVGTKIRFFDCKQQGVGISICDYVPKM